MDKDLLVMNIVKTIDALAMKKGKSIELRNQLVNNINSLAGDNRLSMIYVNSEDNFLLPDIFVMPLYDENFNKFIVSSEIKDKFPWNYSIEITEKAFNKYTAEELTAIILHDALQNVYSSTSRGRLLGAYATAIEEKSDAILVNNAFLDENNHSEILYMMYLDICMRPFKAPIYSDSIIGTDPVLVNYKLADAYNSALQKMITFEDKNISVDKIIDNETLKDVTTARTIIKACITHDIFHYYDILKKKLPLLTITSTTDAKMNAFMLGFGNRINEPGKVSINESLANPSNQTELRFQIDKILVSSRYMESEDERNQLLYRVANLTKKLNATLADLGDKATKTPTDANIKFKMNYVANYIDELEGIRKNIVSANVKPKRYGVFIEYPEGYDF